MTYFYQPLGLSERVGWWVVLGVSMKEIREFIKEKQGSISKELGDYISRLGFYDRIYFYALYKKYWQEPKFLKISENFIPSAFLKESERHSQLGIIDYAQIEEDSSLANYALGVDLICNPMDGGIGSSLARSSYLKRIWQATGRSGQPRLGAKGLDLFFDLEVDTFSSCGKKEKAVEKVSITELKYLQAIRESSFYNKVIIEELVNKEVQVSINDFLKRRVNFWDRVTKGGQKNSLSYQKLIAREAKICLAEKMVVQAYLPTIDKSNDRLTLERTAPGGHGQLGFIVLSEATQRGRQSSRSLVRAIYNGDGLNNYPDRAMVGFMVKNRVPIVMIASTKTPIDKKGGQIGLELSREGSRPQILELAQAKAQGQEELFLKIGLEGVDSSIYGEADRQCFNTNMVLINYSVLSPFLSDLCALIGSEEFFRVICPDLIQNKKTQEGKDYTQLEGALASTILNLTGFIKTNQDKRVRDLLKKHKLEKFLMIINIEKDSRTKFFTPIKFAWDFWFYAHSDYFRINTQTFKLESLSSAQLPNFNLGPFYQDLENCITALGEASTKELKSLTIEGVVFLKDAKLAGEVRIKNKLDCSVDLNSSALGGNFEFKEKRLFLKDLEVVVESKDRVAIKRL